MKDEVLVPIGCSIAFVLVAIPADIWALPSCRTARGEVSRVIPAVSIGRSGKTMLLRRRRCRLARFW